MKAQPPRLTAARSWRTALQNAASVASLMLTTRAMIAERPKDRDDGAAGGGMDGMGGMEM